MRFKRCLTGCIVAVIALALIGFFYIPQVFAAPSATETIDDIDARWQYSPGGANNGGWDGGGSGSAEATEHWSNSSGASISINFNGTGFDLYGIKASNHCFISVQIDDAQVHEVDCYAPSRQSNQKLFSVSDLNSGDHRATVRVLDRKNSNVNSLNTGVSLQYAVAHGIDTNADIVSVVEDNQTGATGELFKYNYQGTWYAEAGYPNLFSAGNDHYSNTIGAAVSFAFVGNKVEVIASLNPVHGIYAVELDGQEVGRVNAGDTTSVKHKQVIFSKAGLSEAQHTLVLRLVSDKQGTQGGTAIQIDAIRVTHKPLAPTGLEVTPQEISLEAGQTQDVSYVLSPSLAFDPGIVWSTSDKNVVQVEEGRVSAQPVTQKTSATLTAQVVGYPNLSVTIPVTVYPAVEDFSAFVANEKLLDTQDNYEMQKSNMNDTWSDVAWKGDTRNSKIGVVTRNRDIDDVTVSISDFVAEGGASIPSSAVDVAWLRNISAKEGRNAQGSLKEYPDVIYKGGALTIPAETLQCAWLAIHVPTDAKPGVYTATVSVFSPHSNDYYTFTYTLEVLDLVQPNPADIGLDMQIWQHPFSVAGYYWANPTTHASYAVSNDEADPSKLMSDEHLSLMEGSLKEYAQIGGQDIIANIVNEAWGHQSYFSDPTMVKWTLKNDGTWAFDYTLYDKWINFAIRCGVLDPTSGKGRIKCYSMIVWRNFSYFDEAQNRMVTKNFPIGSEQWRALWTAFLKDFAQHSVERGWFDITYISMDERPLQQLRPTVDLIESVKNNNGESFKISSALNYQSPDDYAFTDRIQDISIDQNHVGDINQMRALCDHRKELGLNTTIYNCTGDFPSNYIISDPGDNYWTVFYTQTAHANGYMRWAWDNYVKDMHGNVTYRYWEPGDGWFIYPLEDEADLAQNPRGFYSTPRYEMFKQALRDGAKAKYLSFLSEDNKTHIADLIDSMKRPSARTRHGAAVPANQAQRMLTHSETDRIYAGITEIARNNQGTTLSLADKAPLYQNFAEGLSLNKDDYTPESWENFAAVRSDSRKVLAAENPSPELVNESKKRLRRSIDSLERYATPEEVAALQAEVAKKDTLVSDAYTPESWARYLSTHAAASDVLVAEKPLASSIGQAQENLLAAFAALTPKPVLVDAETQADLPSNDNEGPTLVDAETQTDPVPSISEVAPQDSEETASENAPEPAEITAPDAPAPVNAVPADSEDGNAAAPVDDRADAAPQADEQPAVAPQNDIEPQADADHQDDQAKGSVDSEGKKNAGADSVVVPSTGDIALVGTTSALGVGLTFLMGSLAMHKTRRKK